MAIVIRIGTKTSVPLPFWISLYRPKECCSLEQFQTRHQMAASVLTIVRALFPGPIRLLADGAYANRSLIGPARELGIDLVSRLRADAALRSTKLPRRAKKKRGRKPKFGARLGKLAGLARSASAFETRRVVIYGKTVTLLLREFEAYWPAIGRVVKVVITRDPKRPKRVAYLMTTDCRLGAVAVVELFAQRWTIVSVRAPVPA